MKILIAALISSLPSVAAAQATVEAAAGAGRAATGVAAPAKKVGEAIAGSMEKLTRALQDSGKGNQSSPKSVQVISPTTANGKLPERGKSPEEKTSETQYEHPSGIQEGMEVAEVLKRFGPPSLKVSGPGQEIYCYAAKDGVTVDVAVRANKVASIQSSGDRSAPSSNAVQGK
jgi:hypothetical protein